MEQIKLKIGDKTYKCKVAVTEQEKIEGLQGVTELPENEGMLFCFDTPEKVSFWMKDTLIPLDIIFINDKDKVTKVYKGEPHDDSLITKSNVAYVLEVNQNSGIKVGNELDLDSPVMHVIASDGSVQMDLWGGERIVSRRETRILIDKAKKAEEVKKDPEKFAQKCKVLGRYIFKVLKGQNTRKPDYVENNV